MKEPKKPIAPHKPTPPKEFIEVCDKPTIALNRNDSITFQEVIDRLSEIAGPQTLVLNSIRINIIHDDGDYDNESIIVYDGPLNKYRNPKYEKELISYKQKLKRYKELYSAYEIKLAKYTIDNYAYKQWLKDIEIAEAKAILKKHNIAYSTDADKIILAK